VDRRGVLLPSCIRLHQLQLLFADQPQTPFVNAVFQDSKAASGWNNISGLGITGRMAADQTFRSGIGSRIVQPVAEDRSGRLWVGTHWDCSVIGSDLQRIKGDFPGYESPVCFWTAGLVIGTTRAVVSLRRNGSSLRGEKPMGAGQRRQFWHWLGSGRQP